MKNTESYLLSEPRVPFHAFSIVPALGVVTPNVSDPSGPGLGPRRPTGDVFLVLLGITPWVSQVLVAVP